MSTSERMLRLLSLMQTHRYWPGPELASRLAVSERTLRRDVERLRDLGYDVDAVRGVSGGYQLRAGRALPPLLLDTDEAVAIAVGLRSTAAMVVDGDGDAAVSALTKIISMLPPTLRRRIDALQNVPMPGPSRSGPTIDAEALATLAACCRDREIARFSYRAANGEETERRVEPHDLVSYGQRWYLVAYDTRRQDWRTFRLDRLRDVTTFGDRFRPKEIPGGSALEHVKAARQNQPRRYEVVVNVALTPTALNKATGGWGEVTGDGESSSWRISTDALDWPLMLLANLDADFEIVSPPELSAQVRASAERLARCSTSHRPELSPPTLAASP